MADFSELPFISALAPIAVLLLLGSVFTFWFLEEMLINPYVKFYNSWI
jgi:hypothetical protein